MTTIKTVNVNNKEYRVREIANHFIVDAFETITTSDKREFDGYVYKFQANSLEEINKLFSYMN
jgi:hypothetical protein